MLGASGVRSNTMDTLSSLAFSFALARVLVSVVFFSSKTFWFSKLCTKPLFCYQALYEVLMGLLLVCMFHLVFISVPAFTFLVFHLPVLAVGSNDGAREFILEHVVCFRSDCY